MIQAMVAAWIFYQERVLLVLHKRTGGWLPAGGHVEAEEHLLDALRREVQEEVGLSITVIGPAPLVENTEYSEELPLPFRVASYAGKDGAEVTIDFVATTDDDRVVLQASEAEDFQWLSLQELQESRIISDRVKTLGKRAFSYYSEVKH
ncbi:NUDIX domain-containing protein [Candidatus Woesearchaeota archaeon]|nr:NUDIX domain-containing protein [Candidatus Woesearchaeota archaeon]